MVMSDWLVWLIIIKQIAFSLFFSKVLFSSTKSNFAAAQLTKILRDVAKCSDAPA